ncbi:unnamed protein product, partial [Ceratitis capitata]
YGVNKRSRQKPTIDGRTNRHIQLLATNNNMRWRRIMVESELSITRQRVQQITKVDLGL